MSPYIPLTLAGLALAWATFWLGAFDPYQFALSAAAIALAALLTLTTAKPQDRPRPIPNWAFIPMALIPLYLAFELTPLPLSLLAKLSPKAAELATWLHLTSAPLSISPNSSTSFTLRILTSLTVFFLVRQLAWQIRWLALIPVIAIAALEAILGLTQAANSVKVDGTYVNYDHFSFLLEISLPFAIMSGVVMFRESRETRNAIGASVLFGISALILLAINFSLSRAGFMATLVSLFSLSILNLQKRLRVGGFGILAVVFLGLFFFLPVEALVMRFANIAEDNSGEGARHLIWKDSMPIIRDYPIFGTGLGGYETAVRRHQTTALLYNINYAHNEYIQFLCELGIFGLALFLIPAAWILQVLIRNLEDPLAKAGLASAIAILLHCIVDFNLQVPANLLTVAWTLGVSASLLPSTRPKS